MFLYTKTTQKSISSNDYETDSSNCQDILILTFVYVHRHSVREKVGRLNGTSKWENQIRQLQTQNKEERVGSRHEPIPIQIIAINRTQSRATATETVNKICDGRCRATSIERRCTTKLERNSEREIKAPQLCSTSTGNKSDPCRTNVEHRGPLAASPPLKRYKSTVNFTAPHSHRRYVTVPFRLSHT